MRDPDDRRDLLGEARSIVLIIGFGVFILSGPEYGLLTALALVIPLLLTEGWVRLADRAIDRLVISKQARATQRSRADGPGSDVVPAPPPRGNGAELSADPASEGQ